MFKKLFVAASLLASAFVILPACSSNTVDNPSYLKATLEPTLKLPADMDFVKFKTVYPAPANSETSAKELSKEELKALANLKNPPVLQVNKP